MRKRGYWALISLVGVLAGCNVAGPEKVESSDLDPSAAAEKAMELYDTDKSGALSREELAACPGILQALALYDTDKNNQVSSQELQARLQKYVEMDLPLTNWQCRVLVRGQPLDGATVVFEPEGFLKDFVGSAEGTTESGGVANMVVVPSEAPAGAPAGRGIQPGIYKIRITHPQLKIAAKYNTETQLGAEVSPVELSTHQTVVNLR